jgi:5-methylcytosine-specific restriction protein B
MEFFEQLIRFLAQCQTENLKTSHFANKLEGLKVKISFGKGNPARVPWIALLASGQNISHGIYPFYLFYKNQQLLVLAFGVSETLSPETPWQQAGAETIDRYFRRHGLGKPARYGGSFVFRVYEVADLDQQRIEADLQEMLDIYRTTLSGSAARAPQFDYRAFHQIALECGLQIDPDLVLRFIAALIAKPFVILTGLSGAGKTRLAHAFAQWICETEEQVCLVPVGADWTNREPLLGFPNALEPGRYVKPESGVVDLLISAEANPGKPYFLILDEMNLSHVERYFADFLSGMESREPIRLHHGAAADVPLRVCVSPNLFMIGTVNIDETTCMFSPKVLDRASVIEFSISKAEMQAFLQSEQKLDADNLVAKGADVAGIFVEMARSSAPESPVRVQVREELLALFEILKPAGAEFGYRSAAEILRFAAVIHQLRAQWPVQKVMDAALMQKLLPKIYGSRRKLEPVLKALGRRCLASPDLLDDYLAGKKELSGPQAVHYPAALEKIRRIYRNLIDHGFASFAEA